MPRVAIRDERCKGCGLCKEACPKKILDFAPRFNAKGYHPITCVTPAACTGCATCARTCPDMVIDVYR